ncbi:MAG: hypothetical protein IKH88_03620 [Prevotella sp.]|nr:hypothetical protein [Prevotella sp.]
MEDFISTILGVVGKRDGRLAEDGVLIAVERPTHSPYRPYSIYGIYPPLFSSFFKKICKKNDGGAKKNTIFAAYNPEITQITLPEITQIQPNHAIIYIFTSSIGHQ